MLDYDDAPSSSGTVEAAEAAEASEAAEAEAAEAEAAEAEAEAAAEAEASRPPASLVGSLSFGYVDADAHVDAG